MKPCKPSRFLRLMSHLNTVKGNGFIGVGGVRLHTRQILAIYCLYFTPVGTILPSTDSVPYCPAYTSGCVFLPCLHPWMLVFFCPAYISWLHVSFCPTNTPGCCIL